jgi:hypothetical protein
MNINAGKDNHNPQNFTGCGILNGLAGTGYLLVKNYEIKYQFWPGRQVMLGLAQFQLL